MLLVVVSLAVLKEEYFLVNCDSYKICNVSHEILMSIIRTWSLMSKREIKYCL